MGERFIYDRFQGCLVPAEEYRRPVSCRSFFPSPMIASDTMSPVQSMLDGKMYDSKSRLRETYRAAGVDEVGNDPARFRKPAPHKPDRASIRQSIQKAVSRLA